MKAESKLNGSIEQPETDIKKLIRLRGGHRGVTTKLEQKIDLILSPSTVNEEQLCEAEALFATLENRWNLFHRDDADFELLIEDEDDLSVEIEPNKAFNEKAIISIACLESLKNTNRQKKPHVDLGTLEVLQPPQPVE